MLLLTIILLGYIIGSIPTAVWVGKSFRGIDIREHGSKNAGATNTFRVVVVIYISEEVRGKVVIAEIVDRGVVLVAFVKMDIWFELELG